jgi:hypothetical protein
MRESFYALCHRRRTTLDPFVIGGPAGIFPGKNRSLCALHDSYPTAAIILLSVAPFSRVAPQRHAHLDHHNRRSAHSLSGNQPFFLPMYGKFLIAGAEQAFRGPKANRWC